MENVSNQVQFAQKVIKPVAVPGDLGQAKFSAPTSGLGRQGISAAEALKSKKISHLPIAGF